VLFWSISRDVFGRFAINVLCLKKYGFIRKMRHSSAQSRIKAVAMICRSKSGIGSMLCATYFKSTPLTDRTIQECLHIGKSENNWCGNNFKFYSLSLDTL